jgi:hypothetical protein
MGQFVPSHMQSVRTGHGTIYGTVYDPSGGVLPGGTITITHESTNQVRTVQADNAGKFVAPLLPVGTYDVKVSGSGFSTFHPRLFVPCAYQCP